MFSPEVKWTASLEQNLIIIPHTIAYVLTALVFLRVDFLWLPTMAGSFYKSRIGGLLLDEPNLGAAAFLLGRAF